MAKETHESKLLQAQLQHFNSIPWCAEVLRSTPNIVVWLGHGMRPTSDVKTNAFFSRTMNTPSTLSHFIFFYSDPPAAPTPPTPVTDATATDRPTTDDGAEKQGCGAGSDGKGLLIKEAKALLTLGADVDGHRGVCHGGVICAILDVVSGSLAIANRKYGGTPTELPLVTGRLSVRFRRPIQTPGTILVPSRVVEEGDGAKGPGRYLFESVIEDAQRKVLVTSEALFVALNQKL